MSKDNKKDKPQKKEPQIQNVVSLARLSSEKANQQKLDLSMIAQHLRNTNYNPRRFPAVVMRKKQPKSTVLIFNSGTLIIIGSKSKADAITVSNQAAKDIGKVLEKKKLVVKEFNVTNIVANAACGQYQSIGFYVDLSKLAELEECVKEDTFPGCIYTMTQPVKSILIFSSGRMVFTGAKNQGDIKEAFQKIYRILDESYKKREQLTAK